LTRGQWVSAQPAVRIAWWTGPHSKQTPVSSQAPALWAMHSRLISSPRGFLDRVAFFAFFSGMVCSSCKF
jgi:hypothetical protein